MPKCNVCNHNEMGICELCGKEIGISYILGRMQKTPGFCPIKRNCK